MADLKVGQVIDTDPATEMVVTVTRVRTEGTRNVVIFTEAGAGVTLYSKYNRDTGALLDSQADLVKVPASALAGATVMHIRRTILAVE